MNKITYRIIIIISAMLLVVMKVNSQTVLPEEFSKKSIDEQIKYLEDRTRIYDNYRAIREDMFQKINRNMRDTVKVDKNKINELNNLNSALKDSYDSLNIILVNTASNLQEMTATKNSIKVLGLEINKAFYNTIMWIIILVLVAFLSLGFFIFKKNLSTTIKRGKELEELREEFEAYRQSTRIAREKAQFDHFNELKKLKGR